MTAITITLDKIRAHHPCSSGWGILLRARGGMAADYSAPFPLSDVIDSNGIDDALWCLRCLPAHDSLWRLYAVWCARQVQHLMVDARSLHALDVAEAHARGEATARELEAAGEAAWAAWSAAGEAAGEAARAAGEAARDAGEAAWDAAWAAQTDKLRQILAAGEWVE